MKRTRRIFDPKDKAQVALKPKKRNILNEISAQYGENRNNQKMEEGVFGEISSASFKASKMSYSFTEKSKFVLSVLRIAIAKYGIPIIINSNQGGQFTCMDWLAAECTKYPEMQASMDGSGRAKDNIWIERFWKTITYEYIYINPGENGADLFNGIKRFIEDYNFHRTHQGIGRLIPAELYFSQKISA